MTTTATEPIQAMAEYLDGVRGMPSGLDDAGLTDMVRELERAARSTRSVMLDAVAKVESRGIAPQQGFGSTARLLSGMLRLSDAEARDRVAQAEGSGRRAAAGQSGCAPIPGRAVVAAPEGRAAGLRGLAE